MKLKIFALQPGAATAASVTPIATQPRERPLRAMALCLAWLLLPSLAFAQNNPPVAEAGPDQELLLGQYATLAGSATDVDGDSLVGWLWAVESAPADSSPQFSRTDMPIPEFTADVVGDYVLSLKAFDGLAWSAPDFLTIHVYTILPPTATITTDKTSGPLPVTVQFDGSASFVDPHAGTLTYTWTFADGAFDLGPTLFHTYEYAGVYEAALTVVDDLGQRDEASVEIAVATYSVTPQSYDFADVAIGESSSMIFSVSVPFGASVALNAVSADPSGAFTVATTPALPAIVTTEAPVSVEVAFAPVAIGLHEAELVFDSNDPYVPSMRLPLSGTGVESEPPPDTLAEILEFFDAAVASGSLVGDGPGGSAAGRLGALRNMIEAVDDFITAGNVEKACAQLQDVLDRCDGEPKPPDFVSGESAAELNAYLTVLRVALGSQ